MNDKDFKILTNHADAENSNIAVMALWMECVNRVTHGITTIRERDGWRILKTHGGTSGVIGDSWGRAVVKFEKSLT